jgi:hypothetical protein
MKTDLQKQLRKLEKDFANKKSKLLDGLKDKLVKSLEDAAKVLADYPKGELGNLLSFRGVRKLVEKLQPANNNKTTKKDKSAKPARTGKGRKKKIADDEIVAFVSSEKSTKEIQNHFGWDASTASQRLSPLLKAKKVTARKEGVSKFWKAA